MYEYVFMYIEICIVITVPEAGRGSSDGPPPRGSRVHPVLHIYICILSFYILYM